MKNNFLFELVKKMYIQFNNDEIPALAAQVTYYLLLSFFPFLIFMVTFVSFIPIEIKSILNDLSHLMPYSTYNFILSLIDQISTSKSTTLLSFGILSTLWLASKGANALIKGINKAYNQPENRPYWKIRGMSLVFTLGLTIVILFSLVLLVFGESIGKLFFEFLGISNLFELVWDVVRYISALLSLYVVFMALYIFTPNKPISFKEVIPGSFFATLCWILLSFGFSFYINNFGHYSNTYGSIGGIIVLLIWLYWSCIIILLGGELNALLSGIEN